MKRLLLPLCTVLSTLAGWYFAQGYRPAPAKAEASSPVVLDTSVTRDSRPALQGTGPDSLRILAAVERLSKEFPSSRQQREFNAHLYAELEGLESSQFPSAIAAVASADRKFAIHSAKLVAGVWAERDLPAARKWLLELEKDEWIYGEPIFDTWGRHDPAGMLNWLKAHGGEIKKEDLRNVAASTASKTAGISDPARSLEVLNTLNCAFHRYAGIYGTWAERDPVAAASHAMREPSEERRSTAMMHILRVWPKKDLAAARAWAEQIPDPVFSGNALAIIGTNLAERESSEGANFLLTLPQTDRVRTAIGEVLKSWKQKDLDAVLRWTAGVREESLGLWTFQEAIKELAPNKIEDAIAQLPMETRGLVEARWLQSRKLPHADTAAKY